MPYFSYWKSFQFQYHLLSFSSSSFPCGSIRLEHLCPASTSVFFHFCYRFLFNPHSLESVPFPPQNLSPNPQVCVRSSSSSAHSFLPIMLCGTALGVPVCLALSYKQTVRTYLSVLFISLGSVWTLSKALLTVG